MGSKKKRVLALAVLPLSITGFATPAYADEAEGSFISYMDNALTGFQSRRWDDPNQNNYSTHITFKGCVANNTYNPNVNATVAIFRDISWAPDQNIGSRTLYCAVNDGDDYGDLTMAKYYFELTHVNGSTSGGYLDVDELGVAW